MIQPSEPYAARWVNLEKLLKGSYFFLFISEIRTLPLVSFLVDDGLSERCILSICLHRLPHVYVAISLASSRCARPIYLNLLELSFLSLAWSAGPCMYMIWTGLACLNQFINSIIWNGNAIDFAPVWCDICEFLLW